MRNASCTLYVTVAFQPFAAALLLLPPPPHTPPHTHPRTMLSFMLQATDILRRIEKFLNKDNDPDADYFLLCYSGHGSRDGGKWCCDDGSYVTFEQVVDLWQVRL